MTGLTLFLIIVTAELTAMLLAGCLNIVVNYLIMQRQRKLYNQLNGELDQMRRQFADEQADTAFNKH